MVGFFLLRNFVSDNTRVRINFFPEFNIRLYDKNSESNFLFPPPKSEYFFSNIGNRNIFLEKKHSKMDYLNLTNSLNTLRISDLTRCSSTAKINHI